MCGSGNGGKTQDEDVSRAAGAGEGLELGPVGAELRRDGSRTHWGWWWPVEKAQGAGHRPLLVSS